MNSKELFDHFDKKIEGLYEHIDMRTKEIVSKTDNLGDKHNALEKRVTWVEARASAFGALIGLGLSWLISKLKGD